MNVVFYVVAQRENLAGSIQPTAALERLWAYAEDTQCVNMLELYIYIMYMLCRAE